MAESTNDTYKQRSSARSAAALMFLIFLWFSAAIAWGIGAAFACASAAILFVLIGADLGDQVASAIRGEATTENKDG